VESIKGRAKHSLGELG